MNIDEVVDTIMKNLPTFHSEYNALTLKDKSEKLNRFRDHIRDIVGYVIEKEIDFALETVNKYSDKLNTVQCKNVSYSSSAMYGSPNYGPDDKMVMFIVKLIQDDLVERKLSGQCKKE